MKRKEQISISAETQWDIYLQVNQAILAFDHQKERWGQERRSPYRILLSKIPIYKRIRQLGQAAGDTKGLQVSSPTCSKGRAHYIVSSSLCINQEPESSFLVSWDLTD